MEINSFILQILSGRWFMVFASLLIMSVNGTSYMYGLYSGDMKSSLDIDQTTLNTLGFFKDLGGNLGISAGLIFEFNQLNVVQQVKELQVFYNFLYVALGLAGFLMIIIIIQNKIKFTRSEYILTTVIVLVLLFLPLSIVIKQEFNLRKNKKQILEAENPPIPSSESKLNPLSCWKGIFVICNFQDTFKKPERGEDYTILQAIFSIDMLILFISTTCGVGGALAGIDNLGQISDSLGYKKHNIATFISLISIWNFLGRILSGFASEIILTKYNFPRTLFLTLFILLSCAGHALIAFGVPNSLYFSSIILGFCLGAQLSLASTIISEIFGLKHFSTLYSVGSVSSPIGSYIFNVKVAGQLYDKEALKQIESLGIKREIGKELRCDGVHCFRMAFAVITMATFFGFLVSIILVLRTRKFYRKFRKGVISFEEIESKNPVS